MKMVVGFPCYRRLHSPTTVTTIEHLLSTDADLVVVGVEPAEYKKNKLLLPHEERVKYVTTVSGDGCGADMASTSEKMRTFLDDDSDILAMCDDDVHIIKSPSSLKDWANVWINHRGYACLFGFDETNFQKRMDWEAANCPPRKGNYFEEVTRNCSPFVVSSVRNWEAVGFYDENFPAGNDADIQQRFNVLGISVVTSELYVRRGAFQSGGMSAHFGVETWSGTPYQRSTASALFRAKRKYPWMAPAFVAILKDGSTRANWRVDVSILESYRREYKERNVVMDTYGVFPSYNTSPYPYSKRDLETIAKLEEMWPGWKV